MNEFLETVAEGVRALAPYQPGKPIAELEREYGISNIIKLASNENPFGPSPIVNEVLVKNLSQLGRYPDGNGFDLKRKLAAKYRINAEQITLGNGSNDVLDMVARAFTSIQSEVIFSQYAFAVYPIVTKAVGANAVVVSAKDWGHDLEAMYAHITAKTRIIFIANPNNPTGTWLDSNKLRDFIANVPKRILVVVDEAYYEYASHPDRQIQNYDTMEKYLPEFSNLIITRTFSKAYGIAGLRVGFSLSHAHVADILNRVRQPFNVNTMALLAAEAVLDDDSHLNKTIENNNNGLAQLKQGFEHLNLEYIDSAGNFICVKIGNNAQSTYESLLQKGVIVRPIANYDMPQFLRVSVGLEQENNIFLQALAQVMTPS